MNKIKAFVLIGFWSLVSEVNGYLCLAYENVKALENA